MFTRNSSAVPKLLGPHSTTPAGTENAITTPSTGEKSIIGNDLKIVGQGLKIISRGILQVDGEIEGDVMAAAARRRVTVNPACVINARGCRSAKYLSSSSAPYAGFSGAHAALAATVSHRQFRPMRQRNGNPVVTTHSHRPHPALHLFNVLKKTVVGQRRAPRLKDRRRVGNTPRLMFQQVRQAQNGTEGLEPKKRPLVMVSRLNPGRITGCPYGGCGQDS